MSLQPNLTAFYGSMLAYRPTSGTGVATFPNGVDTGTNPVVDTTTQTTVDTFITGSSGSYTFTGFGTGSARGILNMRAAGMAADATPAIASINVTFSYDSVSPITLWYDSANSNDFVSPNTFTSSLVSISDLSTLSVTIVLTRQRISEGGHPPVYDTADAYISLYDLVFLTS